MDITYSGDTTWICFLSFNLQKIINRTTTGKVRDNTHSDSDLQIFLLFNSFIQCLYQMKA